MKGTIYCIVGLLLMISLVFLPIGFILFEKGLDCWVEDIEKTKGVDK